MTLPPDAEFQKLSACIHCGMCLPACPTYRVTGSEAESPRGRLYLMQALAEGRLDNPAQLATHLDPCLGCLGCTTACPSGVDYEALLLSSREQLLPYQSPIKRAFRRFMLKTVLPHPTWLNRLVGITRLYQQLGGGWLVNQLNLAKWAGSFGKILRFVPTVPEGLPVETGGRYGENRRGRVALFTGCLMNAMYHRVHRATITVLVANGYEVVVPEQTCCGALAHHSGERDIAEALAEENVDKILAPAPDWIVVNAAGCGSTLKDYGAMLSQHPQGQAFAGKVVDILELLARHPLEGALYPLHKTVTYHAACHLHHAQRIQQEPYTVLAQLPGITLVPLTEAEMCCGSAGVYNLAHPALSQAILDEKMQYLAKTGAEIVVTGNPGCMLQLESGIRQQGQTMQVLHPVELLAMAYEPSESRPALHIVK